MRSHAIDHLGVLLHTIRAVEVGLLAVFVRAFALLVLCEEIIVVVLEWWGWNVVVDAKVSIYK